MIVLKLITSSSLIALLIYTAECVGFKEAGLMVLALILFACYLKTEGYE